MFDIAKQYADKAWLEEMAKKLDDKMRYGVEKARQVDYIPYSTQDGQWKPEKIGWWTNGFWPASMWQMYLMTDDPLYREEALRAEKMLDGALRDFKHLSHDVGFQWLIQSGVRYALEKNDDSYDRTLFAANTLAGRFNPNGFIRAWNQTERAGWAIVDCMMNLPLLYWATHQTGDPRYRLIAMRHADTTMEYFIRPDGSSHHIVVFDPETGEPLDYPFGQGIASGSSWSRGQAWALYGFVLSHILSGKQEYLDTAKRVAHYFIANVADDWIPRCDFRQPAEPDIRDNAAGGIAACGLLELSRLVPEGEAELYYDAGCKLLRAEAEECANWKHDDPAILTKCTSAYHDIPGRHMTMNYGDYYLIEGINKLRGQQMLFWKPY
ncbi:glycoside hydrolase family 88 protein [Eubacteriales bacterium OttesenSCG-928-A19]|nr:glycoside hydrolase family 88 protein [Eubacteriales bacterium OttesenSCG-928-A19]